MTSSADSFAAALGTGRGPSLAEQRRVRQQEDLVAELQRAARERRDAVRQVIDTFLGFGTCAEAEELWTIGRCAASGEEFMFLLDRDLQLVAVNKSGTQHRVLPQPHIPREAAALLTQQGKDLPEFACDPAFRQAAASGHLMERDELLLQLMRKLDSAHLIELRALERKPLPRRMMLDRHKGPGWGIDDVLQWGLAEHAQLSWWRAALTGTERQQVRLTADGRRVLALLAELP